MQELNHLHLLVSASINNPPQNPEDFNQWMMELVDKIGMKILMGPYSTYCNDEGNEGLTGLVCISTSHSSAHFWENDGKPFFKFDLYSCKDFDPKVVIDHMSIFEPNKIDYTLVDRNSKQAKILDEQSISFNSN
jgi:S-adenosylmethionine/arginine decarboxylase-like enzyme